jgi:anti-sigma factor RsiW
MNCKGIQEILPDLAAGRGTRTLEVEQHIAGCADCAAQWADFRKTMALLDEWQTPEPSPYFDTRLAARLREEMARPAEAWYRRLVHGVIARPVWTMSVAAVLFAAAMVGANRTYISELDSIATNPPALGLPAQPGTAVSDLQALERNSELYADFDVLDELQVQDDVTASP